MGGPAERKAEFLQKIKPLIQPGDVVNFDTATDWFNLHRQVAFWSIRRYQRKIFTTVGRFGDNHSMLYFAEDRLLSVEPPRSRWANLANLHNDKITIWRYTKRTLSENDIAIMRYAAEQLVGKPYHPGELAEAAVSKLLGYPKAVPYRALDFTQYCKASAVGVRVCYEYLRKKLARKGENAFDRLFAQFKYDAWLQREEVMADNSARRGVDVEATSPAHFANSSEFTGEFELVAELDRGRQRFPQPPPEPEPTDEPKPDPAHGHHH